MKRFFKVLSLFATPIIIFSILSIYIVFFHKDSNIEKFRFPENISRIAIGDSHVRLSINDSFLPKTKNIALNSESYLYSYFILKALLPNNELIDTVYLGSSYHNFSAYYDEYTYKLEVALNYIFILPVNIRINVLKKMDNPLKFHLLAVKQYFMKPINTWLGCYSDYSSKEFLSETALKQRINSQYFSNKSLQEISEENTFYFHKIVKLCKIKNVKLIIINTPLYPAYKNLIPTKFITNFDNIMIQNNIKPIEFDLTNFTPKDFLPDGDHVSRSGAVRTTLQLKKMTY